MRLERLANAKLSEATFGGGHVEKDASKVINASTVLVVSQVMVDKVKLLKDALGGTLRVIEVRPKGNPCTLVWSAVVALTDREGRLAFRGIKGSVLQQACNIGLKDLAFHSNDLEATLVYARGNAPAHIDQEPPKSSAEQALLDEWAAEVMAKHFDALVSPLSEGGFGVDKESVSRSGYFVPAPGKRQAPVSTTPTRLSDFLTRRSAGLPTVPRTGGSTPMPRARSPDDGAGVGIGRGYEPYVDGSPPGSAKSSGSNLTVATEAQVVGMMNLGLGRKTARALVAVGVVDDSSLRCNTFEVILAGLEGYLRSKGKEELSLIEKNALSAAMQKRASPRLSEEAVASAAETARLTEEQAVAERAARKAAKAAATAAAAAAAAPVPVVELDAEESQTPPPHGSMERRSVVHILNAMRVGVPTGATDAELRALLESTLETCLDDDLTCIAIGCTKPRFREGNVVHEFCGMTCAIKHGAKVLAKEGEKAPSAAPGVDLPTPGLGAERVPPPPTPPTDAVRGPTAEGCPISDERFLLASARGAQIRAAIVMVGAATEAASAVALFSEVPDAELDSVCVSVAGMLKMPAQSTARQDWSPHAVVPMLVCALQTALDRSGSSLADGLAKFSGMPGAMRAVAVVNTLPKANEDSGYAGRERGAAAASTSMDGVVRAAEAIAISKEGRAEAQRLYKLTDKPDSGDLIRAGSRAMETNGKYGADIALILHQENLDRTPSGASGAAAQVLTHLRVVRTCLLAARARRFEPWSLLSTTKVEELVKAAMTGNMTVALITGAAAAEKPEAKLACLAKAWPMVCELVRESSPRDPSVVSAFLLMAKEGFDPMVNVPGNALRVVFTDVFEEMRKRADDYRQGVAPVMQTWAVVRERSSELASRQLAVRGPMSDGASPPWTETQQSKKQKAAAAAAAAKEAAAKEAEKPPKAAALSKKAAAAAEKAEAAAAEKTAGTGGGGEPPTTEAAPKK